MAKRRAFHIDAIVEVQTNKIIYATTPAEALAQAEGLTVHDFVEIQGDHNDSRLQINGVFAADSHFQK